MKFTPLVCEMFKLSLLVLFGRPILAVPLLALIQRPCVNPPANIRAVYCSLVLHLSERTKPVGN
jgi:hypothetical protein